MRLIVMFDLPMQSSKELTAYRSFSKFLKQNGFIIMQKSVYSRMVLNDSSAKLLKISIKKNLPQNGNIILLIITEKQFASIEYLLGSAQTGIIDSINRVVEI